MRVGIDVRKLRDGGIGTYIRETLAALARVAPEVRIVAFGAPDDEGALGIEHEWVPIRAGKYSVAEHWALPAAVRRSHVDLFHAPHYVLPLGLDVPSVVTVHDVIHLLLPRSPLHRFYARAMIGSACRRAARVLTVSETTARELRSRFAVPEVKLRIISNGVAARFRRLAPEVVARHLRNLGVVPPYVLYVGNGLPHKNVPTLVRAWAGLPEPAPGLVLCGAGHGPESPAGQAARECGRETGLKVIATLEEEELVALYNGAALVASASLYEGFGLPVLEAFACGTPVLGPDAGAVPEIAGDAALLVSPHRVDLLRDGMYRLYRDRRLREVLVEKGVRRAAAFSWDEAARRALTVYREVMERC